MSVNMLNLDYAQVIKAYLAGGKLVPEMYDSVDYTYYGANVTGEAEEFDVICVADVSGSLNSTYFTFSTPENNYAVYFSVDSGGVAPVIANYTSIEVAINEDDTDDAVATALNAVLDALTDATSSVVTNTVSVAADTDGAVTQPDENDTGFTINVTNVGVTPVYGTGKVHTEVYKNQGSTVATLTYTYDSAEKVSNITKS